MIPEFPNFKKLELSDKEEVERFVALFPPYSAFNFINIWAWDIRSDRKISKLYGNLVILFTDYVTEEPFLSFLGTNKSEETALRLLHFSEKIKISPELRFISKESVSEFHSSDLTIKEDMGSFDYLFSCTNLARLQGVGLKDQRHLAKKFLLNYPNAIFKIEDLRNSRMQEKILSVLKDWEKQKKIQNKDYDLQFEEKALLRLLKTATNHDLILSCVFVGGAMIGFSIDEILPNRNAMAHFIKANNSFKGIYEFLNNELAKYLITRNIEYWNWQQDLDIENLRKTKMGYHPTSFLEKYIVSLNTKNIV